MADDLLPSAKSARSPYERDRLKGVVAERGLRGLANDTKWDELIAAMRTRVGWRPSYRYKCIVGPPSGWDVEWFYHLPFPLLSIEWLDIAHFQEVRRTTWAAEAGITDHSGWIVESLRTVGMDYRIGATMIRVFGYSLRSLDLFDC